MIADIVKLTNVNYEAEAGFAFSKILLNFLQDHNSAPVVPPFVRTLYCLLLHIFTTRVKIFISEAEAGFEPANESFADS